MSTSQNRLFSSVPPVTLNIIIINVLVWLAQVLFLTKGIDLSDYLGLHYFASESFYPHQIVTYMFLHDPSGIMHILFNMFAVFIFGRMLETVWGGKRFLFYYMMTGIGAGLINLLVTYIRIHSVESGLTPEMLNDVYTNGATILHRGMNYTNESLASLNILINQTTVGASGAVFGILLAFGMIFPNIELMVIPIPVPIKAKYYVIGYGILELLLGLRNDANDNVAHFAHLGGLLVGLIIILYWKRKNKINGRFY